ncbi:2-C-methyl-D-erythritol 4-phosphate cytidylyltransferase [Buchnera aphidicola str. Ak (Acyrthosiphon kondoi)]|uniref:2-C-methyl-D-erythritol 4-phosphate cytidylyltransferase n=1 Tax=Buchnera aphidicola str. Ak (Acyrthosiphon kondoi) TaxID=1005090 RepID=G2LNC0_9GAMM|nr:2-C-methyl-D-erythritol 4-phosphate cytidylyltransferase [Buchnera aphidicola]AEO08758.1 2-C-methyl-D-erythritol 4-phosphate cytidylyltransferase [Buchnera aphidicola str. Ak (Acyrthosiphon kondoi)]
MILVNLFKPKIIAVVPAAGIGSRMKIDLPKQYMKIQNRTILEHTLTTLLLHPNIVRIIVSLNKKDNYFHKLSISSNIRIISVVGGKNRINSVLSGLIAVKNVDWVIVHDAVRPCLSYKDLEKLISIIKKNPVGALLARPVSDTIKYSNLTQEKALYTVNRKNLWHALTPQLFQINLLKHCLKKIIKDKISITDEASALEYCGYNPLLVLGSGRNIKITWPEDLVLANLYLKDRNF